jgi:molecular chaperone GrpE
LKDSNKAIEIMKAAKEKEKTMKEESKKSIEEQVDAMTPDAKVPNVIENDNAGNTIEETINEAVLDSEEEVCEKLAGEADTDAAVGQKPSKVSKGLFKASKSKELAAKDEMIGELTDRLMRTMAEFDNFRKRSEKEKSQMYDYGVKSIVEKILPIIDNFERGLGTITDKEKEGGFVQGIEMIYKQLLNSLEEIGVTPIAAVGKEFDPAFHNAVMHGEDETLDANIVTDEFQKGYMYHDMVVRHSMVKVVN